MEDMEENESKKMIIHEYDYSDIIPTHENINKLIEYCEKTYNKLIKLAEEDEEKNEQYRYEYRNYMWKKSYLTKFIIYVSPHNHNSYSFHTYENYKDALNEGKLNNLRCLKICLNLSYGRGIGNDLETYKNDFDIDFYPYEITFRRNSTHGDKSIDVVEESIKDILNEFEVANTIFYTK